MKKSSFLIVGIASVALIAVLSGCFLLPRIAVLPPRIVSPANGATNVSTAVTLRWSDPSPTATLDTYKVFFGASQSPSYQMTVGQTQSVESGLAYSTTYYWYIVTIKNSGKIATGTTWHFTTMNAATQIVKLPSAPALSVTSVSTNSVTLSWTQSKNASSVTVYELKSNSRSDIVNLSGSATGYTVTNLTPMTSYIFFVVASNPSGVATSNTVSATTAGITPAQNTKPLTVYFADAPFPLSSITAFNVNISDIKVHATVGGTAEWYTVLATPQIFNFVSLIGTEITAARASLPASALITQIRFDISSATVVVANQSFSVKVPSGSVYLNVASLTISQSDSLYMDFDLSNSLKVTGNNNYIFTPVVHVISGNQSGSLYGFVKVNSVPERGILMTLASPSTTVSETYTLMNGMFRFVAVPTGSYTLTASASGISSYSTSVSVNRGMNYIGTITLSSTSLPVPPMPVMPSAPALSVTSVSTNSVTLSWTQSKNAS
ncbi:MAG: DUF4382 domain-containing protein, partial [Athalassotoga sp.]|uniref:DUF4382 domain-containing protein n=1 Tax=Athalassotoga sp. TaxID=2022597 RepID=UPI003D048CD1